ncbi:MAG TPA: DUF4412 domain-containing protein [Candidatus Kapabacteria bacterium]|nr:DUF4412 domain-containing protein [Candidatus Kapabacteria bacterium]
MNRIFTFIIGACFACGLTGASIASAQTFEGVINTLTTVNGQKSESVIYIKGDQVRTELNMTGRSMISIVDNVAKKVSTLMPAQKMCMVMSIPDVKPMQPDPAAKPVKTGKSETILGYTCDEWVSTNPKTKLTTDMWLAKGPGAPMMGMNNPMDRYMGQASEGFEPMMKDGTYPLRTIVKDAAGKETLRMEVTKIEKKAVDPSLFVVPADYKVMNMPAHMGQMNDR